MLEAPGGARPVVVARGGGLLPAIPTGGAAVAGFAAGFGAWAAVPPDLRQAALMLAAAFYEDRGAASATAFPPVVGALLAPWRVLRLGAGGTR